MTTLKTKTEINPFYKTLTYQMIKDSKQTGLGVFLDLLENNIVKEEGGVTYYLDNIVTENGTLQVSYYKVNGIYTLIKGKYSYIDYAGIKRIGKFKTSCLMFSTIFLEVLFSYAQLVGFFGEASIESKITFKHIKLAEEAAIFASHIKECEETINGYNTRKETAGQYEIININNDINSVSKRLKRHVETLAKLSNNISAYV